MKVVTYCVICLGRIERVRKALVAPFIAKRVWNRSAFAVDLVRCQKCGSLFYNPRMDESEEKRLYTGYRSEEYQQMRQETEPQYTADYNEWLDSPASFRVRRANLMGTLLDYLSFNNINSVLDFGGNRGELVCNLFWGAQAFTYDISGVPAVSGVTAVDDPASCKADLIINSNVLEHVAYPRRVMTQTALAAKPGALVFVEVPWESPLHIFRMMRRVKQLAILATKRPLLALRTAGFYQMHEHVNFFTRDALYRLLKSAGLTVVAQGSYCAEYPAKEGRVMWCLGRVR